MAFITIPGMLNRKAFRILLPLTVFFSILAVAAVCCFSLLWVPTSSQAGSQAAIYSLIKYAAIGLAVLALPFWVGVGLDGWIARIKNTTSRRIALWVIYPALILIFICLPLAAVAYVNLQIAGGGDTGWRKLAPLPEAPAKIASTGIADVIVQGVSGKYYSCKTAFENQCWLAAQAPRQTYMDNYPGQMEPAPAPGSQPTGEVASQSGVSFSQSGKANTTYYAIMKDGSIWYLTRSPSAPGTSDFATGFMLMLSAPFCGAVFLLLLGTGIGRFSRWVALKGN